MTITIPTVFREKENYLEAMLDDAITKDPNCLQEFFEIHLGNKEEVDYIEKKIFDTNFSEGASFSINHLTNFEWGLMADKTVNVRFNMNFMRCISATNFAHDILYLEDDIKFTENWHTKLVEHIKVLDEEYKNNYILSLYAPFEFSHNRLVDVITPGHYYGTQGVYIKSKFQKDIFNKVYTDGVIQFRHQADLLLDEYARDNNIPILCLTTSLIQHIGKESTGLGSFHYTNNFKEK